MPSETTNGEPTDGPKIKIYLGSLDENAVSISDTTVETDLSNQLYNSSTILQKYMDDDLKIEECHIYTWQVPSKKSQN